jgi:hypothetical protein
MKTKDRDRDAPAFDFYPERWAHGTRHLSKVERCDFLDLLAVQWTEDGIVDDLPRIARMLGYRRAEQIPAAVLEKFPVAADGKRRHPFLEKLREEQRERIASRRRGAQSTNKKRWNTDPSPPQQPPEASSLSDRSATVQRLVSESPPPTTHLPPRNNILSSSSGRSARAREPSQILNPKSEILNSPDAPRPAGEVAGAPRNGASASQILNPQSKILHASFPSLPEVSAHGLTIGADPACCEAFWQECEAVHWVNKHGVPIADWRPLLARFRTRWNAIEFQNRATASANAPPDSARASSHLPSALNRNPNRSRHAPAHPSRNPSPITGELNRPDRYASPPAASPPAVSTGTSP